MAKRKMAINWEKAAKRWYENWRTTNSELERARAEIHYVSSKWLEFSTKTKNYEAQMCTDCLRFFKIEREEDALDQ